MQLELMPPRVSVFSRMAAQSSPLPGKISTLSSDRLDAFFVQRVRGKEAATAARVVPELVKPKVTLDVTRPKFKWSSISMAKPVVKPQWRPKQIRSEVAKASANESPMSPSAEPVITNGEPVPEVPVAHSLELKDVFNVELIRQQMTADDDKDIPVDEPGLNLELKDDLDEGGSMNKSDTEDSKTVTCDMV